MKNIQILYILLFSLFLLPGCKTSRTLVQKQESMSQDSLYRESGDSLTYSLLQDIEEKKELFIQHIRYLPPDSLSRQFICSVTQIGERITKKEDTKTSLVYQGRESEQTQHLHKETTAISRHTKTSPSGFSYGIFLFLFLLILIILKIRKSWQ